MKRLVITLAVLAGAAVAAQQVQTKAITAGEAKQHIGRSATVCGQVMSPRYAASSRGQPTFLNLDRAYPNQEFTFVIW